MSFQQRTPTSIAPEPMKFQDAEHDVGFGANDNEITMRGIVMAQIRRIGVLCSVEFRGGYWKRNDAIKSDMKILNETYVEDTRDKFCNSIWYLYLIVLPEAESRGKTKYQTNIDCMTEAFKHIQEAKEEILKQIGGVDIDSMENYSGDAAILVSHYKMQCVKLYGNLFQEILRFLVKAKYLAAASFADGLQEMGISGDM